MKDTIFKWLLVMLGFGAASCGGEKEIDYVVEYGAPMVSFMTKGRVVDAEGNPVRGLQVTNLVHTEHLSAGVLTDIDGNFSLNGYLPGFSAPEKRYTDITIRDIDGEENGGKFAEKIVDVEFSDAEDKGDRESWAQYYSKDLGDIIVELEK